ncbi:NNP family nitrate/nitrite transporter-like MFS transporter [Anoxybacillus voinovskiensis]|uniref:NNP family nitrate/nitrite transporter-like MFS transporter n=1 Tax=Anoxybacteroides voinovskiense TaxID=230470 RepID=A0A840DRZ3_9BACL|nr:nitrate/nitrite transporter [Anoxybacillus voinovskiensis]MBB4074385.1 NNP family nitrate/nitrite transporter-like MFS transporter [Anoxybacillus voinovskiensis]GGJ70331.1 MFS transporter [Anoxybacillus voinovskiensis]
MRLKEFLKVGHLPTLLSSFFYFDVSFMIWVILGATGTFIVEDLGLTPAQKGMMVGIPVLGGAILRIPMGLLADRFGGKRIGIIGMLLTMVPLLWGWLLADSLPQIYALGLLLGVAGASFAVALPLASRWYPKEHQGLAMGIAGAGNSGTVLAMLFGPRIAEAYGWNSVFGLALIPLLVALIVFILFAKDCPTAVKPTKVSEYARVIKMKETWLFSFFYSLSFGGFVGMTSYLTLFFFDQYGVSKVTAGDFVTLVVFAGSFVRPIGGYLADKYGGMNLLVWLFIGATITLTIVGFLPPVYVALSLLFVTLIFFGTANGALFQVIPNVFPKEVGLLTGFVGAAGGLGGFFLPNILGTFKQWTNSYSYGFWWVAATMLVAVLFMNYLRKKVNELH